jgi:SAM-dependent methyltransferase
MFYPQKIKSIKESDKVLEIGPGDSPYHRSNVLLELAYASEEDRIKQFGHNKPLNSDKKVVYYDGNKFPFEDASFDYVICSHVLEHVENVDFFLSELFRVAKRGYLEYPLATYDYLYNFEVHLNFLKYKNGKMYFMKKKETALDQFKPFQEFFLKTLEHNYGDFLGKIPHCFFEGFEWDTKFELIHTHQLSDVLESHPDLNSRETISQPSILASSKQLLQAIKNRIKNV